MLRAMNVQSLSLPAISVTDSSDTDSSDTDRELDVGCQPSPAAAQASVKQPTAAAPPRQPPPTLGLPAGRAASLSSSEWTAAYGLAMLRHQPTAAALRPRAAVPAQPYSWPRYVCRNAKVSAQMLLQVASHKSAFWTSYGHHHLLRLVHEPRRNWLAVEPDPIALSRSSSLHLANTPHGRLAALRSVRLRPAEGGQQSVTPASSLALSLEALSAIDSPLRPSTLFSTGAGEVHYLVPAFDADVQFLRATWPRQGSAATSRAHLSRVSLILARDLFAEVDLLHAAGFVHRAIEPKHVLVAYDDSGRPKQFALTGFGRVERLHDTPSEPALLPRRESISYARSRPSDEDAPLFDGRAEDVLAAGLTVLVFACGGLPLTAQGVAAGCEELLTWLYEWQAWCKSGAPSVGPTAELSGGQLGLRLARATSGEVLDVVSMALRISPAERVPAAAVWERAKHYAPRPAY